MNTKLNFKISTCLLMGLLSLAGFTSCSEDETKGDTSVPTLVSQNIADGAEIVTGDSLIELNFSKAMRQAPETAIKFDDKTVRVSINYERVLYTFSGLEDGDHTFNVPASALTDMDGRAYDKEIAVRFTVKSGTITNASVFDAVVDPAGNGDYTTIQEAIFNAPAKQTKPYLIYVMNGTYNECIDIPKTKPFIHLVGESRDGVKIQYALNRCGNSSDNSQGTATDDQWKYSCLNANSPVRQDGYSSNQNCVVLVEATDCLLANMSIINLYGASSERYEGGLMKDGQAEAFINRQDRTTLSNVKMVSYQDTWWVRNASKTDLFRTYVTNCHIEGHTDYIWGAGDMLCENTTLYNVLSPFQANSCSYITANRATANVDKFGHIFNNCTITGNDVMFSYGRLQSATAKVVFMNCKQDVPLYELHWNNNGTMTPELYAEYNNTDKDGNQTAASVQFGIDANGAPISSKLLTAAEASNYTYENILKGTDNWDPKSMLTVPGKVSGVALDSNTLSWTAVQGANGYIVFENGKYVGQSKTNALTMEKANSSATYTVKAVTKYGMVGE